MLLKLLRLRLQAHPPGAPVQKITLAAEAARPRAMQGGLFLPSFPDPEKLELTIARIANVVGEGNVGSPEIVDTHWPGAFQMRKFHAASEGSETIRERNKRDAGEKAETKVAAGFRAFRPEIPARIELHGGRPMAVSFQGARGEVRAASGPWRTSGGWWREDAWQQEEWELEVKFRSAGSEMAAKDANVRGEGGVYRVYYDAQRRGWFVRGVFD
jgi:protein ImuB